MAVPSAVVTEIGPVVVAGTVAVSWPNDTELNEAVTPLNFTDEVPRKFAPVTVMLEPWAPKPGENPNIVGCTMNGAAVLAKFAGATTRIRPLVAPTGTVTRTAPLLNTVKEAETDNGPLVPLNRTDVVPTKFVPVITTFVPARPLVGEKPVMIGATKKFEEVVKLPLPVVTVIGPVLAPAGTFAVIWLSTELVVITIAPLKDTWLNMVKCAPLIVTVVLGPPEVGEKLPTYGPEPITTKSCELWVKVIPPLTDT